MTSYRDDYWRLAEVEDRFNRLQGEVRKLASTWTLAAFAGLAVLFQIAEKTSWLFPTVLLAWFICVLAALGLALLWSMDQLVYQRLLASPFLTGLVFEQAHPDLPPMRTLMLAASSGAMSRSLRLFYFAPVVFFCSISVVVVVVESIGLSTLRSGLSVTIRALLLAGSLLAFMLALVIYRLTLQVSARRLAKETSIASVSELVDKARLEETLRRAIAHQAQGEADTGRGNVVPAE